MHLKVVLSSARWLVCTLQAVGPELLMQATNETASLRGGCAAAKQLWHIGQRTDAAWLQRCDTAASGHSSYVMQLH